MAKKVLVAYFSASGVTERVAEALQRTLGAELYEIRPAEVYSNADLNWMDKKSRSTLEMNDESCRPALAEDAKNAGDFDTVLVGFPVWWGVEPRVVDTFLDGLDLSGKTIVPFATSGGTGISGSEKHLKNLYKNANHLKGTLLNSPHAIPAFVADLKAKGAV